MALNDRQRIIMAHGCFRSEADMNQNRRATSFGMSAAHPSLGVHLWICPQARHRKGTRTFGRVSRTTMSVVRPVGTGRFVWGHLITMSLTANPSSRKFGTIDPHAVGTEILDETARCGSKMVRFLLQQGPKNTISNTQG